MTKTKSPTTTVSLSVTDNQRLTTYCSTYSIPKKDFIGIILNYLEVNGINPKIHHAPKTELEKIVKRIDQLFGFIKVQEKTFLRPALLSIVSSENHLKTSINELTKKEDLDKIVDKDYLHQIMESLLKLDQQRHENIYAFIAQVNSELKANHTEIAKDLNVIKNKKGFNI